jgi:hypothetical protein
MRFGTTSPTRTDFDPHRALANLAVYVDAELRPVRWLTIRGGVRGDLFHYNVLDRCATRDVRAGRALDVSASAPTARATAAPRRDAPRAGSSRSRGPR